MSRQLILDINAELIVDNFTGGGGASTGIEMALGRPVDLCWNHDPEAVAMHESTISRVTTGKYMHTPRGIFEFRFFFSSHVAGADGEDVSSVAIRARIRKLIADEAEGKPLLALNGAMVDVEASSHGGSGPPGPPPGHGGAYADALYPQHSGALDAWLPHHDPRKHTCAHQHIQVHVRVGRCHRGFSFGADDDRYILTRRQLEWLGPSPRPSPEGRGRIWRRMK